MFNRIAFVVLGLLAGWMLFLSCWTVLAAPNFFLLTLGVGAPEISPWLVLCNGLIALVAGWGLKLDRRFQVTLAASVLGLGLSLWPLVQIPSTVARASQSLTSALGPDLPVPPNARTTPYSLWDNFRGLGEKPIRRREGIPFAPNLSLNLYQPQQSGVYPAVVVIYGGAWQRGNPSQNADFSAYLAGRGYVVVAIDYRHAPAYRFPVQQVDVRKALAHIRAQAPAYEIDPERIALLGRSAGAQLAMLAGFDPSLPPVRAVVSYYGPVDLTAGYNNPPNPDPINARATLETFLGGPPQQFPALYRQASPLSYVTRPLPPTLLIYGGRDHIVEARFGQLLQQKLAATGTTAVFIEIPWAEHAFDAVFQGPSNQIALYYTERFLAWALRP